MQERKRKTKGARADPTRGVRCEVRHKFIVNQPARKDSDCKWLALRRMGGREEGRHGRDSLLRRQPGNYIRLRSTRSILYCTRHRQPRLLGYTGRCRASFYIISSVTSPVKRSIAGLQKSGASTAGGESLSMHTAGGSSSSCVRAIGKLKL